MKTTTLEAIGNKSSEKNFHAPTLKNPLSTQSLITPVGGVTMAANVFFAWAFLGENVTRKDVMATGIICRYVTNLR